MWLFATALVVTNQDPFVMWIVSLSAQFPSCLEKLFKPALLEYRRSSCYLKWLILCHSIQKIMPVGFNIQVTKSEIHNALEVGCVDTAYLNQEAKISYHTCEVSLIFASIILYIYMYVFSLCISVHTCVYLCMHLCELPFCQETYEGNVSWVRPNFLFSLLRPNSICKCFMCGFHN